MGVYELNIKLYKKYITNKQILNIIEAVITFPFKP